VRKINGEKGFALVLTLIILMVAAVFIIAITRVSRNNLAAAGNRYDAREAFAIAESGLETFTAQNQKRISGELESGWVDYNNGQYFARIVAIATNPSQYAAVCTGRFKGINRTIVKALDTSRGLPCGFVYRHGDEYSISYALYSWGNIGITAVKPVVWAWSNKNIKITGTATTSSGRVAGALAVNGGSISGADSNYTYLYSNVPAPGDQPISYDFAQAWADADKTITGNGTFSGTNDYSDAGQTIIYCTGDVTIAGGPTEHGKTEFIGNVTIVANGNITLEKCDLFSTGGELNLVSKKNIQVKYISGETNHCFVSGSGLWYAQGTLVVNSQVWMYVFYNFTGAIVTRGDINIATRVALQERVDNVTVNDSNFSGLTDFLVSGTSTTWVESRDVTAATITAAQINALLNPAGQ